MIDPFNLAAAFKEIANLIGLDQDLLVMDR